MHSSVSTIPARFMYKSYSKKILPKKEPRAIDRFASVVAAASPILGIYSAGFQGIAIIDFFIIPLVVIYLINLSGIHRSIVIIIIVFLFANIVALISASQALTDIYWASMATRSGKFLLYLAFVGFLATRLDFELFLRTLGILGILTYGGVLFQFFLQAMTGSFFGLWLPFLQLMGGVTQAELIEVQLIHQKPSSVFLEPAHLSYFLSIHFITLMYLGRMRFSVWVLFAVVVAVIQSSYGFFLFLVLSFFYLFQVMRGKLSKGLAILSVSIFTLLFLLASFDHLTGLYVVQRLLEVDSVALTGRTEAGQEVVENLHGIQSVVGVGFGNREDTTYMNFIYTTVYSFGWLGFFILLAAWAFLLTLERGFRFVAILILFPLSVASPVLYSYYVIPFSLLIVSGPRALARKRNFDVSLENAKTIQKA